ncbi:NAD(P)/FAD-dependent oxidoreductase [Metabacillus iocasae]|uniref:NAD/FAD-dependent oxidoreductase n=1 Tax=Priestia iocasae TaxID=2291674 RepID=A0ABS2QRN9_9BACI|nr:FAD-dependent oxidoreductase [Metabacillus iocasae]MBM7702130.1 putative NAD/FAD-dependent oxidoreductase [Metabacillus iocasae]
MAFDVVIVGGGMSGIMAARTLKEQGIHSVVIVEKSRSVGGRMATRRVGEGRADHGAQFFTVRSEWFQQHVQKWIENNWVERWFGDPYPRYKGIGGMNALAKQLGEGLDVMLQTKIKKIEETEKGIMLTSEEGKDIYAKAVIVTAPVPQTMELLKQSRLMYDEDVLQSLTSIHFNPCFVGLITMKSESTLPKSGHLDQSLPIEVERIVNHMKKGISQIPVISIYMTGQWSRMHFHESDEVILEKIKKVVSPYLSVNDMVATQLKRWRFAEATSVLPFPFLQVTHHRAVYIAGDACLHKNDQAGRTRLESAFLSGVAVGNELAQKLRR